MDHAPIVHDTVRSASWLRMLVFSMAVLWAGLVTQACTCESESDSSARDSGQDVDARATTADAGIQTTPQHTVQEGETLWDIARAYGVPLGEIMQANALQPGDARRLRPGTVLRLPGSARVPITVETAAARAEAATVLPPPKDGAYHTLRPGESLWTLARHYDVPMERLMERNGLSDADATRLRVGQAVLVPGATPEGVAKAPQTPDGLLHRVASGETVWDLARTFRVSVAEIMAANNLSAAQVTQLREGSQVWIPGVEQAQTRTMQTRSRRLQPRQVQHTHVARRVSARQRRALADAKRLGLGTRPVAAKLLYGKAEPRWVRAAGGTQRLPGALRWPVSNGWFVRGFGSGEAGYHQAVDIMGEIGWNVRAAAPGIVAYAGDELRGYGNIVFVVHPGGWITLYAHNSVNFVVPGERVARGAVLAEVGSTGISRGPHVHFELLFNGGNCDPAPLFRPGVRHKSGQLAAVSPLVWRHPERRPRQIRCESRRRHPRSRWVVNE